MPDDELVCVDIRKEVTSPSDVTLEMKVYCPKTFLCDFVLNSTRIMSTLTLNDNCLYGGIFDLAKNKCSCQEGFSGDKCEIRKCNISFAF